MPEPMPGVYELHQFALAVGRGELDAYPALDADQARSPLARVARREGLDETTLAAELRRGLRETKPGADHHRYLRLAARWLGYRCEQEAGPAQRLPAGTAAGGTLAVAVAAALTGAHAERLLRGESR